jgi:hypothetical protein
MGLFPVLSIIDEGSINCVNDFVLKVAIDEILAGLRYSAVTGVIFFSLLILPNSLVIVTVYFYVLQSLLLTFDTYINTVFFRTVCGVLQAWMQPMNISQ